MKKFSISLACIAIVALGLTVLAGFLPLLVWLGVVALSVITYLVYWWDKSSARKGSWRTPETTLHLLSLGGGWPGALIAQQILRHKTQKQPFGLILWVTVWVSTGVLIWLTLWFNNKL